MKEVKELRISGSSPVKETAGSIVKCYEDNFSVELRAIGASAVNQAVKSVAVARSIFAQKGLDLFVRPGFDEQEIDGDRKTVIILRLEVR